MAIPKNRRARDKAEPIASAIGAKEPFPETIPVVKINPEPNLRGSTCVSACGPMLIRSLLGHLLYIPPIIEAGKTNLSFRYALSNRDFSAITL